MTEEVVVLGSGYAGTGAIKRLEAELNGEAEITWISAVDHHLVLHESHRCIRNPTVKETITFPVDEIKSPRTRFVQGRIADIDCEERTIELEDDSVVKYDYVLVALGSKTAFFGIDGLEEYSLTLKSLKDALEVHDRVTTAAREASHDDPAQVVIGGAGLSGIQAAGEIAAFRDTHCAPIDIHLVEGLDEVLPNNDPVVQAKLRKLLVAADVNIMTGEFITEVDDETVYIGDETTRDYDVLLWTGGITGQECAERIQVDQDDRSHRIRARSTFQTDDERVFCIGDAALIDQPNQDTPAPPTAQAAWQAADVAGENIVRTIHGQSLDEWSYTDNGTLISVGDKAIAHNVVGIRSVMETFGGPLAVQLKKTIAARWITKIAGPTAATKAWPHM
jgi:NADH dehydrogenase